MLEPSARVCVTARALEGYHPGPHEIRIPVEIGGKVLKEYVVDTM